MVLFVELSSASPWKSNAVMMRAVSRKPGLGAMFKAFWLTLVDPANEESLKTKKGKPQENKSTGKIKHVKGRSLKD